MTIRQGCGTSRQNVREHSNFRFNSSNYNDKKKITEWLLKVAGSQSRIGLSESWGKKLEVAPRSSDLSSYWTNINED
jgi:hypothetical protein